VESGKWKVLEGGRPLSEKELKTDDRERPLTTENGKLKTGN
jgi:hypothetical protein